MRNYTTQMDAARKGIVTPELEKVAEKEKMTVEELQKLVAEGKVAICANKNHTCLDPEGVGSMLRTKINVNLGVSRDCKDYDIEMEKVMSAVNLGAEAIMDLSSHGNTQPFRRKLTSECPVMIGTVPVYDSVIHYQRDLATLSAKDFVDVIRMHAEDGVDFVTLHCGITRKTIEQIKKHKRKMNIVSRGGSLVFAWMCMTGEENPFYEYYDRRLDENRWECLVRPGRRAKTGLTFKISDELSATILDSTEDGGRIVRLNYDGVFEEILDRAGEMPLPPYITERTAGKERYQTVYAKENGSAAAPTAGLHFTTELLDDIRKKGVTIVDVLLHVGLGTFRPVSEDNVEDHHMHSEYCECSEEAARAINEARARGGRVFAVGTTSCRTLESVTDDEGIVHAKKGWTDIFITPGYKFKAVDKLITNFHLPESTLLMLVSALCTREEMLDVYKHAVEEKYRFFSFGDAMLIL